MLEGKIVLVTGANRGIGLALVRELLQQKATVFAASRKPVASKELTGLATGSNGRLNLVALEITSQDSVDQAVKEVSGKTGHLDIVINNAAVFPEEGDERFEDLNFDFFAEAFLTNVVGTARVSRAFLPLLRQSESGKLVNISSGAGSIADKESNGYYCYSTSKAALNMMTRALSAELRPEKIVVVPICPGWVKTEMGGPNAEITPEESASSLVKSIAGLRMEQSGKFLSRFGTTDDYRW